MKKPNYKYNILFRKVFSKLGFSYSEMARACHTSPQNIKNHCLRTFAVKKQSLVSYLSYLLVYTEKKITEHQEKIDRIKITQEEMKAILEKEKI